MDVQVVVDLTRWNLLQFVTIFAWIGVGVVIPLEGAFVVVYLAMVFVGGFQPTVPTQT